MPVAVKLYRRTYFLECLQPLIPLNKVTLPPAQICHQNLRSEAPLYTKNNRQIWALFVAQVQQSVCFFIERIYVHLQSVKTYPYP